MLLLALENAPRKLRGYCSSWALQVATGVYAANLPAKTREEIWHTVVAWADSDTRALLIWDEASNEQGLQFRTLGNPQRRPVNREGLLISRWIPMSQELDLDF
jgi:CRISPR-associated endoribonuclease Cas2 subtype I-E